VEYVSREKASNNSFTIRKNFAHFERFRGLKVELSEHEHMIRLNASEIGDVISVILSMVFKINSNVMNSRLKWRTLVLDESTGTFEPWQDIPQLESPALNLDSILDSL